MDDVKSDFGNSPFSSKSTMYSSQMMDTALIMKNLQRIIQESESTKEQFTEKNALIEKQQNKISELLQQNQKYVEQSNQLLAQKNDSFKETVQLNQTKTLQLEEEKTSLTKQLRLVLW